jgi:hypothetical protein
LSQDRPKRPTKISARRRNGRPRAAPDADKTKFDKWLERMRGDRSPVEFLFSTSPRFAPVHSHVDLQGRKNTCQIVDVDRYMLLLEFADGEACWVNKSIIVSAGIAAENAETEIVKPTRVR